ncbi:MAG TPA: sensor histidine kinase efflux regulator BaeS [Dyella sp.]|uniref:sensor histidine kinase efflux regulator BaeS n=1 Tax=Dyella sp. TaxID=1869338 RepID=UPI002C2E8055|nr:sensor histidine kinase efflux regulator BaeS [Dyella sp.]HTV85592.1 sensor histidine kinase efflux regulator BaeS [Dyella sp.]
MRLGLTAKLFIAMLAVAVFAVLAMGVAARWSFDRGFFGYLSEQESARMDSVAASLTTAYREHGNWNFLQQTPGPWFEMMRPFGPPSAPGAGSGRQPSFGPPPMPPPGNLGQPPPDFSNQPPPDLGKGPPPGAPGQSPPGQPPPGTQPASTYSISDLTGADLRFTLLDAQGKYLFGNPHAASGPHALKRNIVVNGRTVGILTMLSFRQVTEAGDLRFQAGQYRATWMVGMQALLLAGLLAIWLARTLLNPVHRIAKATHALARGDYASRVVTRAHDELGQLAHDFNKLALTLERNETMRREFVADVSHELRTPLAIIRGELEALEDGVRQLDAAAIHSLQAEVGTLSKLIDDLYQLSLADLGTMTYRKVDVDVGRLLESVVETFQERLRKAHLALDLRLPAAPMTILADEGRLQQVFNNLIENSVRYTDAGGQLRIACVAAGDGVTVELMDSAPGVDDRSLPRLFDRFYRVEASRNRASGGAGLGLAICRAIVDAHGGSMQAKASPLGGLWLTIHLPAGST